MNEYKKYSFGNGGTRMTDKKAEILNAGRELFYLKGFKDTNVSDITKAAGVGVGTFYNYYDSKEKLFFEVFMKESEKHKKYVMESIDLNGDPIEVANSLISMNITAMNTNLILQEWNNQELLGELEQFYREVNDKNGDSFQSFYSEVLKKWRAEEKIRKDIDDELLLEFFHILEYIDSHKKDMGIKHFPEVVRYLGEFVMKGITDCR